MSLLCDHTRIIFLYYLASFTTRQLHQLPQRCPSGTAVFSVLCCPANCACSKGKSQLRFIIIQHIFTTLLNVDSFPLCCVPAAENLKVCAEVGGDRPSAAESLEGAVGSDCPSDPAASALHSHWKHGTQGKIQQIRNKEEMYLIYLCVCLSSSPIQWEVSYLHVRPVPQYCLSCVDELFFKDYAEYTQSWVPSMDYYSLGEVSGSWQDSVEVFLFVHTGT